MGWTLETPGRCGGVERLTGSAQERCLIGETECGPGASHLGRAYNPPSSGNPDDVEAGKRP